MSVTSCGECGAEYPDKAKFCSQCGKPLATTAEPEEQPTQKPVTNSQTETPSTLTSMGKYEPPGGHVVVVGWILFVLGLIPYLPFGWIAGIALIIILWKDVSNLGVHELRYSRLDLSIWERASVGEWVIGWIFIGIVYFPMYLAKRDKLARAVYQTISERLYMSSDERKEHNRKRAALNWILVPILILVLIVIIVSIIWYWQVATQY